jgi:hypothetical protein
VVHWAVTRRNVDGGYRHFGATSYIYLQDDESVCLCRQAASPHGRGQRNGAQTSKYPPTRLYTVSQPGRPLQNNSLQAIQSASINSYGPTHELHGAESFLRSRQSLSHSSISQHFMEPDSPPLVPILSQINPVRSTPSSSRSILILSSQLGLSLPGGLFPYGFSTKILYAFLFVFMRATRPAHLILLDFIHWWRV